MYQITDLINYEENIFSPCIPLFLGMESCLKGHSYGPRKRDYILIHFVLSGTGSVNVNDCKYKITANQAFIIPAGTNCHYAADNTTPWKYCWIAFYASPDLLQRLFSYSSDLYICKNINVQYIKNIFLKIIGRHFSFHDNQNLEDGFSSNHLHLSSNIDISFSYDLAAALYEILSHLTFQNNSSATETDKFLNEVKTYLDCYYNESLQIQKIAKDFSVHPNYLIAQFKKKFGMPPKQYIINKRISVAYKLLETSDYTIKDISYMVGYKNQLEFSSLFKKITGKSPSAYRNQYLSSHSDK